MDVPRQDDFTGDNVPVKVNAAPSFRGVEPSRTVLDVENHPYVTRTTLRSTGGRPAR